MSIQTTDDLMKAIQSNFDNFLCQFDKNRDGTRAFNAQQQIAQSEWWTFTNRV